MLAINGESLLSKSLDDAVRILQSAGSTVTLKISKGVVSRRSGLINLHVLMIFIDYCSCIMNSHSLVFNDIH